MPFLPFVPFADVAEVVLSFLEQSIPWNLTLGFKFSGAITQPDLVALFTAMDLWWSTYLSTQISALDSLTYIKCTDLTSQTGPTYQAAPATVPNGLLTGAPLSAQAALVVTFNTVNRGRSFRGRNYVGGRVQPDLTTVTAYSGTRVAAVEGAYVNLPGIVGPGGWTHCVLSRYFNNVRRTTGVATPIVSYTAKPKIATIRNRVG